MRGDRPRWVREPERTDVQHVRLRRSGAVRGRLGQSAATPGHAGRSSTVSGVSTGCLDCVAAAVGFVGPFLDAATTSPVAVWTTTNWV